MQGRLNSSSKNIKQQNADISLFLTCACSTCTPGHGRSPTPLPQAASTQKYSSELKATITNSSSETPHTYAATHWVATVYEVIALRREAAQHAVLLLRRRGPACPSPQPAARSREKQSLETSHRTQTPQSAS